MVELGFSEVSVFFTTWKFVTLRTEKNCRGAQGEIVRRLAGHILPALLSADRDCSRRSLQQAPRFWDPGLPGRSEAALHVQSRREKEKPLRSG